MCQPLSAAHTPCPE